MKKISLLLLAMLMITSTSAEENDYVPLVREGVVWEYVVYNSALGIHVDMADIYCLEFNGESEYGHMLYRTNYDKNGVAQEPYLVAHVKEDNKVVSYTDYYNQPYYINIYDFNKLYFMPDEAAYSYQFGHGNYGEQSYELFTVEVGGTMRNGYHINYDAEHDIDCFELKVIEGIGVDCRYGDLLKPYCDFETGVSSLVPDYPFGFIMTGLSAVYENGELVYQGCLYDEAQQLKNPTAITTIAGDRQVKSVCYYNLAGVESDEPFDGVSIRVTTYTDGTRSTKKILK